MLKIVVDGMGGDNAPVEIVKGVIQAVKADKEVSVVLTGDEKALKAELAKYKYDSSRIEIVPTTQVIENNEEPVKAFRRKKDSSLTVAYNLLKTDESVCALVTAGSTGATLAGGILAIGRLKGVSRPALCPGVPNGRGTQTFLCDCGANVECKPVNLVHFAIMASAYATAAYGIQQPRVGLLSNGTEEHKGDALLKEAYELLKNTPSINFVGNVEGRDIMVGDIDIAVCDGFSGNIALKSIEGTGKAVGNILKKSIFKNILNTITALIAWGVIGSLKSQMDYHKQGGAVLLGLKKIVVKTHGSAKALDVRVSILQAAEAARNHLTQRISDMLGNMIVDEEGNDD